MAYQEEFSSSLHSRQQQYGEMLAYLDGIIDARERERQAYFRPDFSSVEAYVASIREYRRDLKQTIGYPPAFSSDAIPVALATPVGEDELCTITRLQIQVAQGLSCYGLYLYPKHTAAPPPLMIALHGGLGCPEVIASLCGNSYNYNDAARRFVQKGYAVFAPLFVFDAFVDPEESRSPKTTRQLLDMRAKWGGTSLAAIEAYKLSRSIDYLLTRGDLSHLEEGVCVSGLSYGGFFALLIAALDERIETCVCSCSFNDRKLLNRLRPDNAPDRLWTGSAARFTDVELAAMVCPRRLVVEAGVRDELCPIDGARSAAAQAADYFERLGVPEQFAFVAFDGTHEFDLKHIGI